MGVRSPGDVPRRLFPIVGLLALLWFLVRVVPKPSRAAYPCQRLAAPLASSFVMWLAAFVGTGLLLHRARFRLRHAHASSALALVGAVLGLVWVALGSYEPVQAYPPHPANTPLGTARGLAPGRVTWVHDPAVTNWAGPGTGETWWTHIDQSVVNAMLTAALKSYTHTATPAGAWDAIFRNFNGGEGYSAGQKIFVKINLTTSYATGTGCADSNYNWPSCASVTSDSISNSPQMMHALLDQLVNVVGASQADITIGDPTGLFTNVLYTPLHNDFPNVHYLDNRGTLGRTRAEFSTVSLYWSNSAANGTTQDKLPSAIADASYLINFAVLKTHNCGGITVMGKNLYGALIRTPDGKLRGTTYNYFDLHNWLPGGCSNNWAMGGMGNYRPLVDLLGHKGIGGKTVLYLMDAVFGGYDWNAYPEGWALSPFDGNWPASLFLSMDPVAIDSVAFDLLSQQWPAQALQNEGVQDYLHEAAQANNPPSGSFYDPEGDGVRMTSQGVHEHWNNPTQKQYSRNLGSGSGIELIYLNTTTTSVTAAPNPSAEGQEVTMTFTVVPNYGSTTPTGNVTVSDGTSQCSATIAAGSCKLTLYNPETRTLTANYAGGGSLAPSSGTTAHTITNLVPVLSSVSPPSSTAGGSAFTMNVLGANFIPGTTILWNGSTRTTTFVNTTHVTALIASTDIAQPGTVPITVKHPGTKGDTSNALTHTIQATAQPFPLYLPMVTR